MLEAEFSIAQMRMPQTDYWIARIYAQVVNTGYATRLVWKDRPDGTLESSSKPMPSAAKPDDRHFRDCPLTGHAGEMPKSTRMTLAV
jgi:hypothetical protein